MTPDELISIRKKRSDTLRIKRVTKNVTQRQLALTAGISVPTICLIESGKGGWNVDSELLYISAIDTMPNNKI